MCDGGVPIADVEFEEVDGLCYLRLIKASLRPVAQATLGFYPSVAAIRRFVTSHSYSLSSKTVSCSSLVIGEDVVWHITDGKVPTDKMLSMFDKHSVLGGSLGAMSDQPGDMGFPAGIPAAMDKYVCWNYMRTNERERPLDAGLWIGNHQDAYEQATSKYSRVRWNVRVHPLSANSDTIAIVQPNGKVWTGQAWQSVVAAANTFNSVLVRGMIVSVDLWVWRPLRLAIPPGMPSDKYPDEGHGDLFTEVTLPNDLHRFDPNGGFCYLRLVAARDRLKAAHALGSCPQWKDVQPWVHSSQRDRTVLPPAEGSPFWHVSEASDEARGVPQSEIDPGDRVGSTQVKSDSNMDVKQHAAAAALVLPARGARTTINIPVVAMLKHSTPVNFLNWSLRDLTTVVSYFESVELVSADFHVTLRGGDNDTFLKMALDVNQGQPKTELDWMCGEHVVFLSGNTQGSTTGQLTIANNHNFGVQLKGPALGNATPNLHAVLDSPNVEAWAYIRGNLVVAASGTGVPMSIDIGPDHNKKRSDTPTNGGPVPLLKASETANSSAPVKAK